MIFKKPRSTALTALMLVVLLGLLAACGDAPSPTTAPVASDPTATPAVYDAATPTTAAGNGGDASTQTVQVSLFEWGIEPKNFELTSGKQRFEVVNKGKFPHDFVIFEGEERKAGTEKLAANATQVLEVDLASGTYGVICSVPGHKEQGMDGTLVIK